MPYPPRESTGKGVRSALLIWVGFIIIVGAFSFQVAGTEYQTFPYDNGKTGTAFYYRAVNPASRPTPIIIYVHGYNNLKTYEFRLIEFTRRGWDVLSIDLPGHGQNQNEFTTGCWKVIFGAVDYVQTRSDLWNTSAIAVVGHSFGGLVCSMGLLFDSRIAAGVLWAPLLDVGRFQQSADALFPNGNPFGRFNATTDSPYAYFQQGKTLNNTLIFHGTADRVLPFEENLNAYKVLEANDPGNETHHRFEPIEGGDHLLYDNIVIRDTIAWLAPYLEPERATFIINDAETSTTVYLLFFALEILALFGLFPALFIIFVDQIGKRIERRQWEAQLELGQEKDEFPLATPAVNRNWKWHFAFYITALIIIIYVGIARFDFLPFHYQLGIMGAFLTCLVFLYEYLRHRWTQWKLGISKQVEEAEDLAEDLIDPWPRRLRRYLKGLTLGISIGSIFLLCIYALTDYFGFLFTSPISIPYLLWSFLMAFAFSLGIEWLLRRRIQVLIDEAKPYNKSRTTRTLNFFLIIILPFVISITFFRFSGTYTPAIYFLFYAVTGLCPVINWYVFDHTDSLIPTVTFSTLVMGWVLAGCLTPAFF